MIHITCTVQLCHFIGVTCRFLYPIVQKAVHNGKKCLLCVFNEDGETTHEEFKMVSCKAAVALYRSITEMHSFFRCDTINSEVFSQVSQDLKGVLASIFLKENNSVGKVFKIIDFWVVANRGSVYLVAIDDIDAVLI